MEVLTHLSLDEGITVAAMAFSLMLLRGETLDLAHPNRTMATCLVPVFLLRASFLEQLWDAGVAWYLLSSTMILGGMVTWGIGDTYAGGWTFVGQWSCLAVSTTGLTRSMHQSLLEMGSRKMVVAISSACALVRAKVLLDRLRFSPANGWLREAFDLLDDVRWCDVRALAVFMLTPFISFVGVVSCR
jgi:hypothetical protein